MASGMTQKRPKSKDIRNLYIHLTCDERKSKNAKFDISRARSVPKPLVYC